MRILMAASEMAPYSTEGGLGNVLASLPAALGKLGEEVAVVSPLYRGVREAADAIGAPLKRVKGGAFSVPMGDAAVPAVAWRSKASGTGVTAYFLQNDRYYDRDGYYTRRSDNRDYEDNSERFVFLSRGTVELCRALNLEPDIIHTHDWPTGLVPIYVKHVYESDFPKTASVFTIHNIAYQGLFSQGDMSLAGLPPSLFTWQTLEYYGRLSFLKAGLVGADVLTTVSANYAEAIQTEESGCGMQGVLRERSADLYGITNGVDTTEWNPANDPLIPANYTVDDLSGKDKCKRKLQERFGLRPEPKVPLIGMVCGLVEQEGLDLLEETLPGLLERDVQFVVLGQGEPKYHAFLVRMQSEHPRSCGVLLEHNEEVAHLIEAGADMILMPTRYEPCGMNQLYSMLYGTVPIVAATGGLAGTVTDCSPEALKAGEATGFVFEQYGTEALVEAVDRALVLYPDRRRWRRLMRNGMRQDWSWERSAAEYLRVYERARGKLSKKVGVAAAE